MRLSHNGLLLATFCSLGHVKIWETETWSLVQQLRDAKVKRGDPRTAAETRH